MNANAIKRTTIALILALTAAVTAFEISGTNSTHAKTPTTQLTGGNGGGGAHNFLK